MSSMAALQPAVVVFHEEQYFDWRVYALTGGLVLLACLGALWWTDRANWPLMELDLHRLDHLLTGALVLAVPTALVYTLLYMTTEVVPSEVRIWFGWFPVYRRAIAVDSIKSIEVVEFRPWRDHGGWGIRSGPDGERVLTARGNRGVRIVAVDGSKILIGSQRAEALAIAVQGAVGTNGAA